jgi:hypothetical protein
MAALGMRGMFELGEGEGEEEEDEKVPYHIKKNSR